MDARSNFAFGILTAGISFSDTSLSVETGSGSRFATAPFNAVIWNKSDYPSPAHAYYDFQAEIVRVTNVTSDTLTITRGQEGTTAVDLNSSGKVYEIWAGPTALSFQDFEDRLPTESNGSPEGVISGYRGKRCWDYTNNIDYIKTTNGGNTGWYPAWQLV